MCARRSSRLRMRRTGSLPAPRHRGLLAPRYHRNLLRRRTALSLELREPGAKPYGFLPVFCSAQGAISLVLGLGGTGGVVFAFDSPALLPKQAFSGSSPA